MTSTAQPTRGRIIEVTSNRWEGKRPAIIVSVEDQVPEDPNPRRIRANVFLDGKTDQAALHLFRGDENGNTVTLEYSVQSPEPGLTLPLPGDRDWFCGWWMPFQVGQVPASLAVQGDLTAAKEDIAKLHHRLDMAEIVCTRFVTAIGFLASKLELKSPGHPRHDLAAEIKKILAGEAAQDEEQDLVAGVITPPDGACLTIEQADAFFESLPAGGIGSVMCRKPDGSWLQAMNLAQATDFFNDEPHQPGNPPGSTPPDSTAPVTQTSES